jgi:hypothetical protein
MLDRAVADDRPDYPIPLDNTADYLQGVTENTKNVQENSALPLAPAERMTVSRWILSGSGFAGPTGFRRRGQGRLRRARR